MNDEIISYIYPTLLREGMASNNFYPPQISIIPDSRDGTHSIAITAGLIVKQVGVYYFEVGIFRDEKSVITSPEKSGKIETSFYERVGNEKLLTIYSMIAHGIDLSVSGLYRISVEAYRSIDGVKEESPAAENNCYFWVSHRE